MVTYNKLPAVLAVFSTTVFWGISYSVTKILLGSVPAIQIAFLRHVLAALVLACAFLICRKVVIERSDLARTALGGITGILLYFLFETNGLRFTTAATGSLIVATIPVLNIITGAVFFRERHCRRRWLGVLLSFLGVYLVIRAGNQGTLSVGDLKGNILVFLAACSWVAYNRINEPLLIKYDSLSLNFYQVLLGVSLFFILTLFQAPNISVPSSSTFLGIAYLGVFCSAIAYFFYLYALKNLGTAVVTSFINLVPVFGILGGVMMLGETLAAGHLLGGAVVITGVSLVTVTGVAKEQPQDKPMTGL